MGGIRVIDSERRRPQDVEFAPALRWIGGVAAAVVAGLLITAVVGEVVAYGERQEMRSAITALTNSVDALTKSDDRRWERYEMRHEEALLRIEELKARVAAIDRRR